MTRKKVKLGWVVSDTARKASMRKRKQGLLKKVRELTILCGVHAFVVIFGFDNEQPAVWPSRATMQQLLQRFNEAPETDKGKKTTTQESYLKERIAKVQDQLRKQNKKNQELVADHIMFQLSRGTQLYELKSDDLISLFWMTDHKIKETQKKIEYFKQVPQLPLPPTLPPRFPVAENRIAVDPVKLTENGLSKMDQWFINMMMNNNDMPGSSSASVYGGNASVFGGNGRGGLVINRGTGTGFNNQGGFDICNYVKPTMQFPREVGHYNCSQQMNEVNLYQPQENYGINQLGDLVNGGLSVATDIEGGFPRPELEKYGGGDMGGNHVALEFPDEQNNMDFLIGDDGNETGLFLQELYEDINDDGDDLTLPFDFSNSWDNIFPP